MKDYGKEDSYQKVVGKIILVFVTAVMKNDFVIWKKNGNA